MSARPLAALLAICVSTIGAAEFGGRASRTSRDFEDGSVVPHDFHVSYGRLAVEGEYAVCNIRFFRNDLTDGLKEYGHLSDLVLDASPRTDSLFMGYLNTHFAIKVDQEALSGSIIGSGEDYEGKEAIWWYTLQYQAPRAIEAFQLVNKILIERFDDQKNIVKIQSFPSEKTMSYYFDVDDTAFDVRL